MAYDKTIFRGGPFENGVFWTTQFFVHNQRFGVRENYWLDNRTRNRPFAAYVIQLTVSGSILYGEPGYETWTQPGDVMLFKYHEPSWYGWPPGHKPSQPYITSWINLLGAGLSEHWDLLRKHFGSVIRLGDPGPMNQELVSLFAAHSLDPVARAGAVAHFLGRAVRMMEYGTVSSPRAVTRAVEEILRNPPVHLSIKEIADTYRISREHLTRAFMAHQGVSPGDFLRQERLRRAQRLLLAGDATLAQVAVMAGFGSSHAMIRSFKRELGQTPDAFRKKPR
jgi:AraC-like DNA-binding protein